MENKDPYNRKPLWYWLVLYLIIGLIVYIAVYFLFFRNRQTNSTYTPVGLVDSTSTSSHSGKFGQQVLRCA